eukprot:COSAG01_NODE_3155_length_6492_cov_3.966995_2_plen_44_part_00
MFCAFVPREWFEETHKFSAVKQFYNTYAFELISFVTFTRQWSS